MGNTYQKASLRLTLIYSVIFLVIFELLSLGIYIWFSNSLGEGYIAEVRNRHIAATQSGESESENREVVDISANVALEQLRTILISSNIILLIAFPLFGRYLTIKTLKPIAEVNERQRQFVLNASHELKTPLIIMEGEMQVALRKDRSLSYYKKIIRSSKEEIDEMSNLVTNLLFLAKHDYRSARLSFRPVDITDILGQSIAKFRDRIAEKDISLKFTPPKYSVSVYGEESMLITLFSNILDNAFKYTKPKGKVWIRISSRNKNVKISVKDSGSGISNKDIGKVFERFYRGNNARSTAKGFGLGLSIAELIVKTHRGRIKIDSKLGKGTNVSVFLPKLY